MPLAFIWFYKHKMAETKITKKKRFFSFVHNSYSYWQNSTKSHAKVEYTYWNNILKFFLILLISTIFPPTVPFDPVSRYTPVSPTYLLAISFAQRTLAPLNGLVSLGTPRHDNEGVCAFDRENTKIFHNLQYLPKVWEHAREPYGKRRFSRRSQKSNFRRNVTNFFTVAIVCRN
jgi:hypothetical protein